jgi:hypothetical protein
VLTLIEFNAISLVVCFVIGLATGWWMYGSRGRKGQ